jgi:oligopeptide transport system substrate-binding protein
MKNFGIYFTCVLFLFASLVGCTKKQSQTEKVLEIAVGSEVKGMDPIYANDRYSSNEVARIYEGLLEYHYLQRPYKLVPNLASEMPAVSADGLTYTFKIKKGILFHNDPAFPEGKGREVVAKDFVYSLKRLADPKLQSTGWWVLDGKIKGLNEWRDKSSKLDTTDYSEKIEGLVALDKYTLQFKLSKSFPQFLYALAMPFTFVVSEEVVKKYGKEFLNHPVGTGPFILPVFEQTTKITYLKNPTFRAKYFPKDGADKYKKFISESGGKKLPLVDKVVVNIIKESQPKWLNFQKGRIDYIAIPKDNFDSAVTPDKGITDDLKKKGITLLVGPSLDVTYTGFNHDLELFKNVNLRRAMAAAFDVNKSNELFYNNNALPAQSIVPPGISGYINGYNSPYRGKQLELAKKLLAEAGYPGGKGLPEITYDCPSSTISRQIGEFFKKQMAEIGINVTVTTNTWPQLQSKIAKRQIMTYGIAWGADYPDAENFLQLLYGPNRSPGANGSGFDNPEFNSLFKKAALMQDTPQRTSIYQKLYEMAADLAPLIYGVHRQNFRLTHSWLKNFLNSDFDAGQAQYLDVDLELKNKLMNTF